MKLEPLLDWRRYPWVRRFLSFVINLFFIILIMALMVVILVLMFSLWQYMAHNWGI
ncbi:MAG TPA: hypothetical protein VLL52_19285 [Anaerolineae bacterium]|nr:hypothetical protein [Anaerolineae bacterium]